MSSIASDKMDQDHLIKRREKGEEKKKGEGKGRRKKENETTTTTTMKTRTRTITAKALAGNVEHFDSDDQHGEKTQANPTLP